MYLFGKTIKKSKGMVYTTLRKLVTSEGVRRRRGTQSGREWQEASKVLESPFC